MSEQGWKKRERGNCLSQAVKDGEKERRENETRHENLRGLNLERVWICIPTCIIIPNARVQNTGAIQRVHSEAGSIRVSNVQLRVSCTQLEKLKYP